MEVKAHVLHEFQPVPVISGLPAGDLEGTQHSWTVNKNPSTGSHDELCVVGTRVIWYEGLHPHNRTLKKVYSVEGEVLQAFWCEFPRGEKVEEQQLLRCVCVREDSCMTLFMETGAVHYVPLPFLVRCVWPICGGILVERQVSMEMGNDGLPTLFTLLHPLDDFCPVTFRRPTATVADITVLGFFSDPQMRVVCTCVEPATSSSSPLLACYDTSVGRHSIWAIQHARTEDIPAHLATPRHSASNTATPRQPLSTSAPSHYVQFTPQAPLDTPVEMILSNRKGGLGPKFPVIAQLQKMTPHWGVGGGGSGVKVGSGRSPFISRLQTPQSQMIQLQKRSKSLSPPLLARISPFSQTINSRSWSTFYSEESFGDSFEPLIPQICLRLLWKEREEDGGTRHSCASSVFRTRDLTGGNYLVISIPHHLQIWLLPYQESEDNILTFSPPVSLPAIQATPLPSLDMMVVLDPTGQLVLYSGSMRVATIDVSSPMGSATAITGIRDPIEDSFTAVLGSGSLLRCSLPQVYRHPVVALCLQALEQLIPTVTSHKLLTSYYISSHLLPYSTLLPHFSQWLLACLGLSSTQETKMDAKGEDIPDSWQRVEQMMDVSLHNSLPALQLFQTHQPPPAAATPFHIHTDTSLQPHSYTVIFSLHFVYEEIKLNTLHHECLGQMASLLHKIASHLGWLMFVDHYQRDFPTLLLHSYPEEKAAQCSEECMEEQPGFVQQTPPHLLHWLYQKLRGKEVQPFPLLPSVCKRTAQILKLYGLYTAGEGETVELPSLAKVVGGDEESLSPDRFKELQSTSAIPHERVILCMVEEGIQHSDLECLPVGVALPLWDSIIHCQETPPSSWPQAAYDIIGRADIAKSLNTANSTLSLRIENPKESDDGMNFDLEILRLRFPKDLRVNELRRLLQSSNPVRIALIQKPEVSDHEFIEQQESHLLTICQRTMALPVGRGMFTLSTVQPLPTAPLAIPTLNLTGRAPPKNAAVGLDHIDRPANMTEWAEFHNGVAAGLRITPGTSKLDSTWIVFNSPSENDSVNEYAGFLMALGLNGHLTSLSDYALYEYLQGKHDLTVVGLLLGIAAARVGSMSTSVSSLLSIYLPPLLPLGSADMEVSHTMQTAAMVSMGLLYLASGNRHLVEVMLREIGHAPGPELEFAEDRPSYSLAAGLALGMITLGQGGTLMGLSDLQLVDQLCVYMNGGSKREVVTTTPFGPSHLVLESDQVNTHVTAPGAIMALGLMYLKTNDSAVAARLDAPGTLYELDCIRPDFLMLRAISRGLIMWDTVEPSQEWIDSNIPQIVHEYAFDGSKTKPNYSSSLDYQTISQAYVNITAGYCLVIGLCYAGTCDLRAHQCLLRNARRLLSRMESPTAEQTGKPCLESCLNTVMLAVAMVMSGSGDLEVLRLIRQLHVRVSHPEVTYGSHMATHMALGLLFLGGGRYSFSRSNKAVVALLCTVFPRFPLSSTDNRYHFQALRHLYVLAAEPRVLVTRDVRTGQACSVEVCVTIEGEERCVNTPCVVPEWSCIEKVEVCSPHYWPVRLDLSNDCTKSRQVLSKSGTVFVKQRLGHLQKRNEDKDDSVSGALPTLLSSQHYSIDNIKGTATLPSEEVSSDPLVKALWDHTSHLAKEDSSWSQFCSAVLLECISQEKLPILTTYLQLEQTVSRLSQFHDTVQLWQVKLAGVMCSQGGRGHSLLSTQYTNSLHMRTKQFLAVAEKNWCTHCSLDELLKWYLLPGRGERQLTERRLTEREALLLALTMILFDVPPHYLVQLTPQVTIPQLYMRLSSLDAPVTAVVRLLPIVQSLPL